MLPMLALLFLDYLISGISAKNICAIVNRTETKMCRRSQVQLANLAHNAEHG